MVAKWLRSSDRAYLLTTQEGDAVSPRGGSSRRGRRRERGTGARAPSTATPDGVSDTPDVVSPVPDVVSPAPDGESSTGDLAETAEPKATSKRKGKGKAKKADVASTDSVRDDDAAHAEFIAQFPTTDPDAVADDHPASETTDDADATDPDTDAQADDTSVAAASEVTDVASAPELDEQAGATADDVTSKTDDSETARAPGAAEGMSADDEADTSQPSDPEPEAAMPDAAEPSEVRDEAEADAATSDVDVEGEAQQESADDAQAGEDAAAAADAVVAADAAEAIPAAAALDPDVDGTDDPDEALLDDDDDVSSWVRPYVWTGGRTETSMDFAIETLVSAREQVAGTEETIRDEHRRVLELCEQPRSVTEIAALLSVPLGVVKTLLGAMVEDDLVVVHRTNGSAAGPDLALMERVLRGLKKL